MLSALATGFRIYDCYTIVKALLDEPDVSVGKIGDKVQNVVLNVIQEPTLRRLTKIILEPIKTELVGAINYAFGLAPNITHINALGAGWITPRNSTTSVPAIAQ